MGSKKGWGYPPERGFPLHPPYSEFPSTPTYGSYKLKTYTLFSLDHDSGRWNFVTTAAKGQSVEDATRRYYEQGPYTKPKVVIGFPTCEGRRVKPPCAPEWTTESL